MFLINFNQFETEKDFVDFIQKNAKALFCSDNQYTKLPAYQNIINSLINKLAETKNGSTLVKVLKTCHSLNTELFIHILSQLPKERFNSKTAEQVFNYLKEESFGKYLVFLVGKTDFALPVRTNLIAKHATGKDIIFTDDFILKNDNILEIASVITSLVRYLDKDTYKAKEYLLSLDQNQSNIKKAIDILPEFDESFIDNLISLENLERNQAHMNTAIKLFKNDDDYNKSTKFLKEYLKFFLITLDDEPLDSIELYKNLIGEESKFFGVYDKETTFEYLFKVSNDDVRKVLVNSLTNINENTGKFIADFVNKYPEILSDLIVKDDLEHLVQHLESCNLPPLSELIAKRGLNILDYKCSDLVYKYFQYKPELVDISALDLIKVKDFYGQFILSNPNKSVVQKYIADNLDPKDCDFDLFLCLLNHYLPVELTVKFYKEEFAQGKCMYILLHTSIEKVFNLLPLVDNSQKLLKEIVKALRNDNNKPKKFILYNLDLSLPECSELVKCFDAETVKYNLQMCYNDISIKNSKLLAELGIINKDYLLHNIGFRSFNSIIQNFEPSFFGDELLAKFDDGHLNLVEQLIFDDWKASFN